MCTRIHVCALLFATLITTIIAGSSSATLVRQLTSGNWIVENIVGIVQDNDVLYIMGTYDSCCEKHLYAISLTGTHQSANTTTNGNSSSSDSTAIAAPVKLTYESGMHNVIMDHSNKRFVDVYSTPDKPAVMVVYTIGVNPFTDKPVAIQELHNAMDDRVVSLKDKLIPAEIFTIRSRDNKVDLYLGLYKPDTTIYGSGPYPTIVAVYGGPHVQRINNSWLTTVDMRAQRLRDLGFAVVKCDNRGSYRRGLEYEGYIRYNMGSIEVRDQEDAVRYLIKQGITDAQRVGIYGWSYGGYLTAMCMCKAASTFHCGVSGAPVTSWDGYDTHYTERYMSTPQANPIGYKESSVLTHASKLQGKLMLVHGLIDEVRHVVLLFLLLIVYTC
jgi:dipeptidyl-peptidase 4